MPADASRVDRILADIRHYTDHEGNPAAVLANVAAVAKGHRPNYAWVGFYLREPYPGTYARPSPKRP